MPNACLIVLLGITNIKPIYATNANPLVSLALAHPIFAYHA